MRARKAASTAGESCEIGSARLSFACALARRSGEPRWAVSLAGRGAVVPEVMGSIAEAGDPAAGSPDSILLRRRLK